MSGWAACDRPPAISRTWSTQVETRGKMIQRHKREAKDLQAKIKKMGKKGKDEAAKLEKEMEDRLAARIQSRCSAQILTYEPIKCRHAAELKALEVREKGGAEQPMAALSLYGSRPEGEDAPGKKSKAQKARERRAKEEAEREARIAEELDNLGDTQRSIEERKLHEKLLPAGLLILEVPSDGHCLFRAVEDQLRILGPETEVKAGPTPQVDGSRRRFERAADSQGYLELRRLCTGHMRRHPGDFLPYVDLDGEEGSEDEEAEAEADGTPEERFERYCERMGSTAVWGGQIEIRALAEALERHIVVHSADMPDLHMGEEFKVLAAAGELAHTTDDHAYLAAPVCSASRRTRARRFTCRTIDSCTPWASTTTRSGLWQWLAATRRRGGLRATRSS